MYSYVTLHPLSKEEKDADAAFFKEMFEVDEFKCDSPADYAAIKKELAHKQATFSKAEFWNARVAETDVAYKASLDRIERDYVYMIEGAWSAQFSVIYADVEREPTIREKELMLFGYEIRDDVDYSSNDDKSCEESGDSGFSDEDDVSDDAY